MATRGKGDGAVYQTPDGRWRGAVTVGWVGTKRQRKFLSGRTKAEVLAKVRDAVNNRDQGTLIAGRTPTVEQWFTHWLDTIAVAKVRPSTLYAYRGYIQTWVVPSLGRVRLDALTPEHLDALYRAMLDAGRASGTALKLHRIVSRALKVAVQRGRVARNVATLVDAPSLSRHEIRPLIPADARKVLAVAAQRRNAPRWSVALALGLRQGEALGLCWDDVDFAEGTLSVRRALQRQPGTGLVLVEPKSRAGWRTIVLPATLARALRAHRQQQIEERLAEGPRWVGWHGVPLVFTQPDGRPIGQKADWREWMRLCELAGVPRVRLHDARHTAATLMLAQGIPARVVMEVLGHSQVSLTLGTYSHVIPELAKEAAARIDAALWAD